MAEKVVRLRERPKARPDHRRGAPRGRPSAVEVLDTLRQRIARQEIPPGSKLREHDLADEFGVPRTRSRNVVVAQMLDSIYEKTNVIIRRIIILPGRAEVGLREHQAVLAAMRRGDAAEAEQLKRQNLRSTKETLMRFRSYVL